MSIVVKQAQQSFRDPYRQLQLQQQQKRQQQQQSRPLLSHNRQQFSEEKLIGSTTECQVKCVKSKAIKSKQILEQQQAVAVGSSTEEEKQTFNKHNKLQSQDQEEENLITENFENLYLTSSDSKDYQTYQNGKVNEFFENDRPKSPKRVADICLVNDHYILVKMPDQEFTSTNRNTVAEASARRKEFRTLKEQNVEFLEKAEKKNKQLCRYLRNKRNRITKISPIREEPEDLSSDDNKSLKMPAKLYCLKMQSCCQGNPDEVEIYHTQTKIFKSTSNSACIHQQSIQQASVTQAAAERKPHDVDTERPKNIPTISGTLLKSSLHYEVSLQQYGSLIETQNGNSNNNNNDDLKIINNPPARKYSRFENLNWLLRPFNSKYRKPKPKIQAVVYKTYFVKWTKPPDTQNHGYDIKPLKSSNVEMSVLRRCRSAFF